MINPQDQEFERFSAGEQFAVNPDAIERELASLWRSAGQSSEDGQAVTRACLWNTVVHVEERDAREGSGHTLATLDMVNAIPRYLATRTLVMRTRAEDPNNEMLESWISANCLLSGNGRKLVCSEEITLASRGSGDRLLASLVRALLVPGVPTAAVFDGVAPQGDATTDAIVQLADRIVVHADRSQLPNPLARIQRLAAQAPGAAIDLGWLLDRDLRQEIAALFDPPRSEACARSIDHVRVVASPKKRWSTRLLVGWIAGALGAHSPRADSATAWTLKKGDGTLKLEHEESDTCDGTSVTLSVPSESTQIKLAINAKGGIDVTEAANTVRRPCEATELAQLLARALTSHSQDQSFMMALAVAEQLR